MRPPTVAVEEEDVPAAQLAKIRQALAVLAVPES
jgi:hypothetical protein